MVALFRLVELAGGSITIDGIDISQLGLYDVRSVIAIIPQDPVLFKGTIRTNLDPFGQLDDATLYQALRRVHLIDDENEKTGGGAKKFTLDDPVGDEGSNFSLGQRQLLAMARALVRRAKIIVMDEATSSVDYETDANIQITIKEEFKGATLLVRPITGGN
jgi:ATP-binding cassette subfamily C (CFTR/MRP) protein 1